MGKNDIAIKRWLSDKKRFADLFNGTIFEGEQIIRPDELEIIESEADILFNEKNGKNKEMKRYRDIVMRWRKEIELVILACENQENIHYAMPVRNMLYDGISYTEQIEELWKEGRDKRGKIAREEFLSHFRKEDVIYPVITIVFYYGNKLWDGSIDIHGMFPKNMSLMQKEIMEKYVPNYRINLVDLNCVENLERFQRDLQVIFGMVKCKKEKTKFLDYVENHRDYFQNVDGDTYYALGALLDSQMQLKEIIDVKSEKEDIDMCKALQDWYDEGVELGMKQGELKMLFEFVQQEGYPILKAAEKAGLSEEEFCHKMMEAGYGSK